MLSYRTFTPCLAEITTSGIKFWKTTAVSHALRLCLASLWFQLHDRNRVGECDLAPNKLVSLALDSVVLLAPIAIAI